MGDETTPDLAQLHALLDELRTEVSRLRAEVADLQVQDPALTGARPARGPVAAPATSPVTDASASSGLGRRRLLVGGATAGAAAVAGVVATGQPAAAANGGPMVLGTTNTADGQTQLNYGGSTANGFRVQGASTAAILHVVQTGARWGILAEGSGSTTIWGTATSGDGVRGESSGSGDGIYGRNNGTGRGVFGEAVAANGSDGVFGKSAGTGRGVAGEAGGTGVYGVSTGGSNGVEGRSAGTGVYGYTSEGGIAVAGFAPGDGTGMKAESESGLGLHVEGGTTLRLAPQGGRSAPTGDVTPHVLGDVVADATGALWYCTVAGTPGTWRKLGGVGTSGQLHVLPAPARVYDSRPFTTPTSVGPKTKFAANETRAFDLKVNGSGVPVGATAALVTLLVVDASTTAGNMTIWANGITKPLANTLVWGGTAGRFTATATTAVDSQARVQVNASQTTNLVIDVVGYYR